MKLINKTVGFAMTGSFCTFSKVFPQVEKLAEEGARVIPIMSETSYTTDTRFGKADEHIKRFEEITGETVIASVRDVEPIGPKKLLDVLVIAPCTGNSLAKIATGIADSSVTLAVKSHLRNKRPVVIAVSTNDGLGNNAKNIGTMANMKNGRITGGTKLVCPLNIRSLTFLLQTNMSVAVIMIAQNAVGTYCASR